VSQQETELVLWHDIECGSYHEDLGLWRELAERNGGPVLDVGAGTGRVSIDLAGRGHDVIALDHDRVLLASLQTRAASLPVSTVVADARHFVLREKVPLCIVPMQTIQLLGGAPGRAQFLRCAHDALRAGGTIAVAIADALEGVDAEHTEPPLPDIHERGGWVYVSQPVAVRDEGDGVSIERVRQSVAPDGTRTSEINTIVLDKLSPDDLEAQLRAARFEVLERRTVPATDDYVGSTVVLGRR
jgi:SAM-dependent methyltransferase